MIVTFNLPIYESCRVHLVISDNPNPELDAQDIQTDYSDNELKQVYAYVSEFTRLEENNLERPSYVFFIRKTCPQQKLYNCIGHEMTHLMNFICKWYAISRDVDHDEGMAYLAGWIYEKIMTEVDKVRKKHARGKTRKNARSKTKQKATPNRARRRQVHSR